jgi:hypothetical protein
MIGTLARLAMMAGTSASIAGLQRAGRRFVVLLAASIAAAVLLCFALACGGVALYIALLPHTGPLGASLLTGLAYLLAAAIVWGAARVADSRTRRAATRGVAAPIGAMAGVEALSGIAGGVGGGIREAVGRNGLSILLAAFVAGMVMTRRR